MTQAISTLSTQENKPAKGDKGTAEYRLSNEMFIKNEPTNPLIIAGILNADPLTEEVLNEFAVIERIPGCNMTVPELLDETENVPNSNKMFISAMALRPSVSIRYSTKFMSSPRPPTPPSRRGRPLPPPSSKTKPQLVMVPIPWSPSIPPPPGESMTTLPDLVPIPWAS